MPTERSVKEVESLKSFFNDASLIISTNYTGLNVAAMDRLRSALRGNGVKYRIAKNTLARIAADEVGRAEIKDLVDGPCGFVMTDGDPAQAAKTLMDHLRTNRLDMEIRGAVLNDRFLPAADVRSLASLPSRDVLLGRLLGQMNAPVTGLVSVLNGTIRGLAVVLQRHAENLQGQEAA